MGVRPSEGLLSHGRVFGFCLKWGRRHGAALNKGLSCLDRQFGMSLWNR